MSLHHVPDREAAAAEIARVLRPGGRVLLRSTFSDRMPDLKWMRYFPRAREIEMQMFPSSEEVIRVFANAGLTQVALVTIEEQLAPNSATMPKDCGCGRSRHSNICLRKRSSKALRGWMRRWRKSKRRDQSCDRAICSCSARAQR